MNPIVANNNQGLRSFFGAIEDWNLAERCSLYLHQYCDRSSGRSRIGTCAIGEKRLPLIAIVLRGDRGLEQA